MRICIVDYDAGNIGSVKYALSQVGCNAIISSDPADLELADKIILPGVGSFATAMETLHARNLVHALKLAVQERQVPILGICLGMQLFATSGTEGGASKGLNFIPGTVDKIPTQLLRLPHVGWNAVEIKEDIPLFKAIQNGNDFYFLHSFHFSPLEPKTLAAHTHYGQKITAVILQEHVFGVQFHPEKSGKLGLQLLKNFISL